MALGKCRIAAYAIGSLRCGLMNRGFTGAVVEIAVRPWHIMRV
jgi:hypothetical protein